LDDVKAVLQTDAGKRLLWRLLNLTEFFKVEFTGNSKSFYDTGLRAIGGVLHHEIVDASGGFAIFDEMRILEKQAFEAEELLLKELREDDE
jgi:hypothetical protein